MYGVRHDSKCRHKVPPGRQYISNGLLLGPVAAGHNCLWARTVRKSQFFNFIRRPKHKENANF